MLLRSVRSSDFQAKAEKKIEEELQSIREFQIIDDELKGIQFVELIGAGSIILKKANGRPNKN
jgi:hypothetical protein